MCYIFSFAKGQQTFEIKPVNRVKITQIEHLLIYNSEITQNLNIYLYNYQTEAAVFIATKHEKTIMACSYLNFYQYFLHFELLASKQYYKK